MTPPLVRGCKERWRAYSLTRHESQYLSSSTTLAAARNRSKKYQTNKYWVFHMTLSTRIYRQLSLPKMPQRTNKIALSLDSQIERVQTSRTIQPATRGPLRHEPQRTHSTDRPTQTLSGIYSDQLAQTTLTQMARWPFRRVCDWKPSGVSYDSLLVSGKKSIRGVCCSLSNYHERVLTSIT